MRARHNELQRIEQTLLELASMFQDLAVLVEQQEVAVQAAEVNADNATKWTEQGNQHVGKGIKSARNRRKLKWWCLLITILIIIIAVGVGAGMYLRPQLGFVQKLTRNFKVLLVLRVTAPATNKTSRIRSGTRYKASRPRSYSLKYTQTKWTGLIDSKSNEGQK